MKILAQYEVAQRRYYDPYYQYRVQDPVVSLIAASLLLLSLAIWLWILSRLTVKAGYKGVARWVWFAFLAFPLTGGLSLIAFVLVPWPVQKQLKQMARNPTPTPAPRPIRSDIDEELDRLKQGKKE